MQYKTLNDIYRLKIDNNDITLIKILDRSIKNAIIPNGVITIDDYAFEHCTSLKSITLPKKLKAIGKSAFEGCHNLKQV